MARLPLSMSTVKPIRISGGRGPAFALDIDQRGLARGYKLLDHYRDASLYKRMQKATLAGAKVLEGPIRSATPVSRDSDPGQMKRSVRARSAKVRTAFVIGKGYRSKASTEAIVGPRDRKSHLVIRSHRIVTRGGRDTGRMTRPNPYVDLVADRLYRKAVAEMREYIFDTWRP